MTTVDIRPGLSLELSPLTTKEAMQADTIIGTILGDAPTSGALALLTSKVYSICAVRKYTVEKDGAPVTIPAAPLAGGQAFDTICGLLSLSELTALMTAYSDLENIGVEALKKLTERGGIGDVAALMVLSKGGITYRDAMDMTTVERNMWAIVLGKTQGYDFDWKRFEFLKPSAD